MKLPILLLSLSTLLFSCSSPVPASETALPPGVPDPFDTPWSDRSPFQAGLIASRRAILDELPHASIYHIEFNIAPSLHKITGMQEVRYTNAEEISLDRIVLRLFPNILGGSMTVSNLTVNGEAVSARLEMEQSMMTVPLASPLPPGQSAVLKMDFALTVPRTVDLNYGVLSYYDDVLTLAHAYPMIAVYDDEGWNAEIPPQSGDVTYADAAFFLVRITAPADLTVVTSGTVLGSGDEGNRQIQVVASGPARDFYLAASPLYRVVSRTVGETTFRSYAPARMRDGAEMALDVAARAVDIFSGRYASFPYTELDIVATPTLALGIEYPGAIAITSRIYEVDEDFGGTRAREYMEATVAHEVAHQWFYGLVGGDQLDDPWLDESLTQFATLQYFSDAHGPAGEAGFRRSLEARWQSVGRAKIPIGLPVASYTGQEYSAIVYGRGAFFFLALREQLGHDKFEAFLREYTETLAWGVSTPDVLQSLAEDHCACDLDALFHEWVFR